MGSPPPPDFPEPGIASGESVGGHFTTPSAEIAGPCGISFALPSYVLGYSLKIPFTFPPPLPQLNLHFKLTCDPTNPIDVSGGLSWGAGRTSNAPADPDDTETDPTF